MLDLCKYKYVLCKFKYKNDEMFIFLIKLCLVND